MFLIFIILHNLSLDNFNKQCQQRDIVHSGGNDSLLGTNEDGGGSRRDGVPHATVSIHTQHIPPLRWYDMRTSKSY